MPAGHINNKCQNYLVNTAYVAGASKDVATNMARWLKDSTKWSGLTNATARLFKLITSAASS